MSKFCWEFFLSLQDNCICLLQVFFLIILLHDFGQDGRTALQLADGGGTNEILNLIQIHMEKLPVSIPIVVAPASSASDAPTSAISDPSS
jgi:hypothetical protein